MLDSNGAGGRTRTDTPVKAADFEGEGEHANACQYLAKTRS
ncbi:hypothetical protein BEI_0447 [Halomonas beimenensis]|uniref:Uncharacterized protein n=1 Tax=Halomonas beimenensis TaxID=475662 RepID=A0A291P3H3_9GAMM|nr:hypothetical protein BEI_0447 [Halomonas beimenensis]